MGFVKKRFNTKSEVGVATFESLKALFLAEVIDYIDLEPYSSNMTRLVARGGLDEPPVVTCKKI